MKKLMSNLMNKLRFFAIVRWLLYLFFAVLPFQIGILVGDAGVYESGFFNPYLSHFVCLGDLLMVVIFLFVGLGVARGEKLRIPSFNANFVMIFSVFLLFVGLSIFWSVDVVNSVVYFVRLLGVVGICLLSRSDIVDLRRVVRIFLYMMGFVAILGVLQFVLQGSVGVRVLGEPNISVGMKGVAKVVVGGLTLLRSYGTFPHPNVFGGFLVVAIVLVIWMRERKMMFTLLPLFLIALVFTFSRSAWLALGVVAVVQFLSGRSRKMFLIGVCAIFLAFVGLVIFEGSSFSERILFLKAGKNMFFDNPFGVGAGNFTAVMQGYIETKLDPWLIQPVHNIFVLAFDEFGIFGGLWFLTLFLFLLFGKGNVYNKSLLLIVAIIGLFDHYWLTLYQGQVMMCFLLTAGQRL